MKNLLSSLLFVTIISCSLSVAANATKLVYTRSINTGSLRNAYRLPAMPATNNYGRGNFGFTLETGSSKYLAIATLLSSETDQAQQVTTVNQTNIQHPAPQQLPPKQKPTQHPKPFPHPKPKPEPYPTPLPNPNPDPKPLPKPIPQPMPQPVPEPQPIK